MTHLLAADLQGYGTLPIAVATVLGCVITAGVNWVSKNRTANRTPYERLESLTKAHNDWPSNVPGVETVERSIEHTLAEIRRQEPGAHPAESKSEKKSEKRVERLFYAQLASTLRTTGFFCAVVVPLLLLSGGDWSGAVAGGVAGVGIVVLSWVAKAYFERSAGSLVELFESALESDDEPGRDKAPPGRGPSGAEPMNNEQHPGR